jgi:hypothetical protein
MPSILSIFHFYVSPSFRDSIYTLKRFQKYGDMLKYKTFYESMRTQK